MQQKEEKTVQLLRQTGASSTVDVHRSAETKLPGKARQLI
ncbi:hypothetical protein ABIE61_003277 [Marinobacterium sp. MBR-111]